LHQPAFQALEATWRALALLAARLEEDVELWLLDVSKAELAASGDGLADRVLSPPGGRAWSALIGAFSFGSGADDVDLLGRLAVLASRAAAPFVGGAAPELLGCRSLAGESDPARWPGLDTDAAGRWQSLRQSPDAVWVGLALPRFLARAPYGAKSGAGAIDAFRFEESTGAPQHDALCWASSAFLCALVLAAGEDAEPSGEIDDLPFVSFRAAGETEMYPAAEVFWSERAATAVLLRGLMPVLCQRDRNSVRIVRLQSIADPPAPLGG
jgi:type VI secretion system protein ImpC